MITEKKMFQPKQFGTNDLSEPATFLSTKSLSSKSSSSSSSKSVSSEEISVQANPVNAFKSNIYNTCESKNYVAEKIFKEISHKQNKLKSCSFLRAIELKDMVDKPHMIIEPLAVHIISGQVGKGVQSSVYDAMEIPSNGNTPLERVIKFSSTSYEPEFKLLKNNLDETSLKDPRIDHIEKVFEVNNEKFIAICQKSDGDLKSLKYVDKESPVKFIVGQLKDMAGGISLLHKNKIVHRDIKGANLLYNTFSNGKVTDVGLAKLLSVNGGKHGTPCTPFYAPSFIWKNIKDQNNRRGYQGLEADVASFGKTIQYDVINSILSQLGEKYNIDVSFLLEQTKPVILSKPDADSLEQIENENPGRVIIRNKEILVFPTLDKISNSTKDSIKLFKDKLNPIEYQRLKQLALLADDLQINDPNALPTILEVEKRLTEIENMSEFKNQSMIVENSYRSNKRKYCNSVEGLDEIPLESPAKKAKNDVPTMQVINQVDLTMPLNATNPTVLLDIQAINTTEPTAVLDMVI